MAFGTQSSRVQTRPKPSEFFWAKKKKSSARLPFGEEVKAVLSHVADLRHVKEP
jgi:hypothetical protein